MKQITVFKEWAPDVAALGNPFLMEAKNVIPEGEHFTAFNPLSTSGLTAAPARPIGGFVARGIGGISVYAGDTTAIWLTGNLTWSELSQTTYALTTADSWSFAQYEDMVIATGSNADFRLIGGTVGSTSTFNTLSSEAPYATQVGTFGQFVFALNARSTTSSTISPLLQWNVIDNINSWPPPNSATAIAGQSGSQQFSFSNGLLTSLVGTDQFACVFQGTAITRMTYAGPPVVFQFDKISDEIGTSYPNSVVQVANKIYFLSSTGVYMTDGVNVVNIGEGRVNNWLLGASGAVGALARSFSFKVTAAADPVKKLVYWGFPSSAPNTPTTLLIYNYERNKFSWALQNHDRLMSAKVVDSSYATGSVYAFDADNSYRPSIFAGTPGAAVLATGDVELSPMGRSFVSGLKANVESTTPSFTLGLRVGYRDSLDTAPSYTSTTSPYSATAVAPFRVDAKYVRAEVNISGPFNKISGIEFDADPSSER